MSKLSEFLSRRIPRVSMINIDINPDPSPDRHRATSTPHQNLLGTSPHNFPSPQGNDRQHQDDLYNNPSHSPVKHPFQKKYSTKGFKADDSNAEDQQGGSKGQDEGRTVPRRLETLAEQEVKMNTIHQNQMTGGYRPFQETGDDSEENNESLKAEEENEKENLNFFQRLKSKKGRKNKKNKEMKRQALVPIAKRILIDDVARQKDYYGKNYRAQRVVTQNGFALALARIAIRGKDPKASETFKKALEKVNKEALKQVRMAIQKEKRNRVKRFFPELKKKLKKPFYPNSTIVMLIGMILFFTILAETFFTTYLVTFYPVGQLTHGNGLLIVCYIGDFVFFLRILLSFRIAIYDKGELNTNFQYITLHYLKGVMFLDLFTLLNIIGYFFLDSSWRALMTLAVIRMYKIPIIIGMFEDYFQVSRELGSFIRVLKLGLILFVYAHMCGCALYAVGFYDGGEENSWITNGDFENLGPGDLYVISVYWASQTITTVGYGDITPVKIQERILLIALFLGSSIVLGYIISTIASILAEMSTFTEENWEKIRLLKRYMDDKGLKKETQDRIMKYVRYYLGRENIARIKDSDMMQFLSENLKEDIIKEVNVKMMRDCAMFSYNFGRPFLLALSKELKEKSYGPDEYIFRYKDNDSHSAFFILAGQVELVYGKCNIRVALLEKTNIFGFMSFFVQEPRSLTAKSLEFTTLFELTHEVFRQKLKEFPSENETYCLIKDNIGLYRSNENLADIHCYLCGKSSHLSIHCPIVHWYSSPLKVVSKHLREQEKLRKAFKRRPRERFSALGRIKDCKEAAEKIQKSDNSDIVKNVQGLLIFGQEEVDSYSSTDEILDRNIYNPEPLVFAGDMVESKELEVGSKYIHIPGEKEQDKKFEKEVIIAKPKVEPGEIQTFVTRVYDPQLHNLNLDQAMNFEIYFPHNNVQRVLDALEMERIKKVAKAFNLPEVIIKNFKFGVDKGDPRTFRQDANSIIRKCTERNRSHSGSEGSEAGYNNILSDVEPSQRFMIPSQHRLFSGSKPRDGSAGSSKKKTALAEMAHPPDEDSKENLLPSEENLHRGDEELFKKDLRDEVEEAPSLNGEEDVRERSDDSKEYCMKVLGSDYDELMRKFTEMLADSMKKKE